MGAYAASRSAVSRLTESLAAGLKDAGVRVNAVLPSIIDTPATRASMPDADVSRRVAPDALAEAIAFLLSDDARAITGALLPVMGRVRREQGATTCGNGSSGVIGFVNAAPGRAPRCWPGIL